MTEFKIELSINTASELEIMEHLSKCDSGFVPPLSTRVDMLKYARKLYLNATRFEARVGGTLVGLVCIYCNDHVKKRAHISSVSVLKEWTGKKIGTRLIEFSMKYVQSIGMKSVALEVSSKNDPAIKLYKKSGFVRSNEEGSLVTMILSL